MDFTRALSPDLTTAGGNWGAAGVGGTITKDKHITFYITFYSGAAVQ